MSLAIRGVLECDASVKFATTEWEAEWSFYLLAIQLGSGLAMASPGIEAGRVAKGKLRAISGEFWEELISYRWAHGAAPGVLDINVSGEFAFELGARGALKQSEVADGPIEGIVIGWAKDGDSPKQVGDTLLVSGHLRDVVIDDHFEGLSL